MSEDTVTEDMMDFTGEGTYLLFDLNVAVTGKATLPAGTFPVASGADAEENTIAPGADYGGGMMTGSAIVKINSDGTKIISILMAVHLLLKVLVLRMS